MGTSSVTNQPINHTYIHEQMGHERYSQHHVHVERALPAIQFLSTFAKKTYLWNAQPTLRIPYQMWWALTPPVTKET